MDSLQELFSELCGDHWAFKVVSHNDMDKEGLYATKPMQAVMSAAGLQPVVVRKGQKKVREVNFQLIDSSRDSGYLTYYESQRGGRPEVRMGRDMISSWLSEGDQFFIGWTGYNLIAAKHTAGVDVIENTLAAGLERTLSVDELRKRALQGAKKPARKQMNRIEYERNPAVIAYVKKRAEGFCEMPRCSLPLFRKIDGTVYLEVHHVKPLAEGGEDSAVNTAALCPMCHRAQHHAGNRDELRSVLSAEVISKEQVA